MMRDADDVDISELNDQQLPDRGYSRPKPEIRSFATGRRKRVTVAEAALADVAARKAPRAANLFDTPTPATTITAHGLSKITARIDPAWLVERVLAGDPVAYDVAVEIVYRIGWSALRTYDED